MNLVDIKDYAVFVGLSILTKGLTVSMNEVLDK